MIFLQHRIFLVDRFNWCREIFFTVWIIFVVQNFSLCVGASLQTNSLPFPWEMKDYTCWPQENALKEKWKKKEYAHHSKNSVFWTKNDRWKFNFYGLHKFRLLWNATKKTGKKICTSRGEIWDSLRQQFSGVDLPWIMSRILSICKHQRLLKKK